MDYENIKGAIPRKEMELSDVEYDDVYISDVWMVNFPFEEEEQRDEKGDSTWGKIRPALVIGKIENAERSIVLVKGTTSYNEEHTNPKYVKWVRRIRLDCSKIAILPPHHLLYLMCTIPYYNKSFNDVCDLVDELEDSKELRVSTYEQAMLEAKLKADERTDYGLPKKKKYPMPDEAHVLQAIRMFNHCDPEDEAELARNIKKYMKKYNMKDVKVGKNNRFSKYYHTKAINEETEWDQDRIYNKFNKRKFDKIKNFDQFCKQITTPEEALSYLIIEKVKWPSTKKMLSPDRPFYWPDDLISTKSGCCIDTSILMYYFCKHKKIETRVMHIVWNTDTNKMLGSHAVPVFKKDDRVYSIIYLPNYIGWIHGPFYSYDECAESTAKCLGDWAGIGKTRIYGLAEYFDEEFMNEIDKVYGRRDIKFYEWCAEDGYRRFRKSKALMFRYKDFAIWNPIVPVWNTIRWLRNTLGLDIPYFLIENCSINEEVRMWGYEIRAMVNESIRLLEMSGGGGPMIGMEINDQSVQYSSPGQFIITTKDKDSGVDYGVTNDIKSKYLYRKDKDKGYVKEDMELYLKDKDYKIYQYTGDIDIWKYMLSDIQYNSYDEDTTIYEDLTGKRQLTDDQIDFDENFRYYNIKQVLLESSILNATTKSKLDELKGKKTHLFDTNIKVSDKFSVAESIEGYCLRYGDYHSDFVSLDELTKIYNV